MPGYIQIGVRGLLGLALACSTVLHAQDIKIGTLFPLSGRIAVLGDVFNTGVNLAVDHLNADKMLSGKLSIVAEDSQGAPQQGVIGMSKLVNVDKVPYVMSGVTGVLKAIAPIGQRANVVTVNGGGVGPDLAELGPYAWNVIPLATIQVQELIPFMVKDRGLKRFVIVYLDDPTGEGLRKALEKELPKVGGELVEALSIPVGSQQFSGIAAKVRAARPDAIFLGSVGPQQVQLVKQLRDNGVTQQLATYYTLPELDALPEAKGMYYTSQVVDWESKDPLTRRFVTDFKARYNRNPDTTAANYYNAVRLFGALASELQKQGKPINAENLLAQRLAQKSFDFIGGKVGFDGTGTVMMPIQVNEITGPGGGKMVSLRK